MLTGRPPRLRIIGSGRAGTAMGRALEEAGWTLVGYVGRGDDLSGTANDVDLLLIATPDAAISAVAALVTTNPSAVVAHLAGSLGLDVLAPHPRRAAIHPLVSLPRGPTAAARLGPPGGAWFAVAGDDLALEAVRALGGRIIRVADQDRDAYHAAAVIASNHLVALLGQVERVAGSVDVPLEAFLDLVRGTVDNVAAVGPAAALTGPVARGDWETVARHEAALPIGERPAYEAMAALAARLAGHGRAWGRGPHAPEESGVGAPGGLDSQALAARLAGHPRHAPEKLPLTVIDRADAFRKALNVERASGRTVGLVPTMGALHAGHLSLMDRAAAECDVVATTLFVNPLQFGPNEDLSAYPRDLDGDRRKTEAVGVSYLFAPSQQEMFPRPPLTTVRVSGISDRLEGTARPGHFDGVATIVAKLFALAGPCRAYFGEKDYQQLCVIRHLVAELMLPVQVVGCPTVRDIDGLALSSRNAYLTPDERAVAGTLYAALLAGRATIENDHRTDADAVRTAMAGVVATQPRFRLDYAEVVNAADLTPLSPLTGEVRLLIAARLGRARLIDNMGVHI